MDGRIQLTPVYTRVGLVLETNLKYKEFGVLNWQLVDDVLIDVYKWTAAKSNDKRNDLNV